MAGNQMAAPSHLSFRLQGQGLQSIQMMNINRNSKAEDILEEYKTLRDEDAFTDLEIVAAGGRGGGGGSGWRAQHQLCCRRRMHSVVMAASSDFLGHWMEQVVPFPSYTIVLPDVGGDELDAVIGILYGAAITVSPALAPKIHALADMLGISVDLPFKTSGVPDNVDGSSSRAHLPPPPAPPVCCWHCNLPFGSVGELQTHLQTHQGERFSRKKKLHKCKRCDKVLPSMWKFRQHLLSHETELAALTARPPPPPVIRQPLQEPQQTFHVQQPHRVEQERPQHQEEEQHDPIEPVVKDHSYGSKTVKATSQDAPAALRMDHLYSARRTATPPTAAEAAFVQPQQQEGARPRSLRKRNGSEVKKRVQVLLPVREEERQRVLFSTHAQSAAASAASTASTTASAACSATATGSRAQLEVKSDHAYSSAPPSPMRPQDPLSLSESSSRSKTKKPAAATATKKAKTKRGPSIQALGHSYAAARPVRKCSEQNPYGWWGGGLQQMMQMYPCDQCEKTFPQPYRLNRHIREVHLKEKKYYCSVCDKAFFKITSRERHEMTHTEHARWKCDVCEKLFGDQSSLRYHERNRVCTKKTRSSASAVLP